MILENWLNNLDLVICGVIVIWILNQIRKNTSKYEDDDEVEEEEEKINEDDMDLIMEENL